MLVVVVFLLVGFGSTTLHSSSCPCARATNFVAAPSSVRRKSTTVGDAYHVILPTTSCDVACDLSCGEQCRTSATLDCYSRCRTTCTADCTVHMGLPNPTPKLATNYAVQFTDTIGCMASCDRNCRDEFKLDKERTIDCAAHCRQKCAEECSGVHLPAEPNSYVKPAVSIRVQMRYDQQFGPDCVPTCQQQCQEGCVSHQIPSQLCSMQCSHRCTDACNRFQQMAPKIYKHAVEQRHAEAVPTATDQQFYPMKLKASLPSSARPVAELELVMVILSADVVSSATCFPQCHQKCTATCEDGRSLDRCSQACVRGCSQTCPADVAPLVVQCDATDGVCHCASNYVPCFQRRRCCHSRIFFR